MRNELWDRMADENVCFFNVTPYKVPDVSLWCTTLGNEITPQLDMRAEEDWSLFGTFLDHWNEANHLRIVNLQQLVPIQPRAKNLAYNDDVGATLFR